MYIFTEVFNSVIHEGGDLVFCANKHLSEHSNKFQNTLTFNYEFWLENSNFLIKTNKILILKSSVLLLEYQGFGEGGGLAHSLRDLDLHLV